ncbi:hypothetical protein G6011_00334 [Alternaria panax]|uniref:Uncharacterized protein n=1 Tax=Alternaria panax TaxID=48097 RepID=A0AAD4IJ07_9PLEO|nr:hypothetical protein G6011_00334 [Alternaria panax]
MDDLSELGRLQAPLRRMTAQSQFQHERVAKLKRELQEATKEMCSADLVYRKHLLYYARKDCLQLATLMHRKLPIELRELVYEFLCVEPDRPIPVGPYYHFRKYDRPFHDPYLRISRSSRPHIGLTWPPRRAADPNSYAANASVGAGVDVEIREASAQQTGSAGLGVSNDTSMISDLTERIMETALSSPADQFNLNDEDDNTILPDGRIKEEHTHKPPSDMILPYSHFLDPRYVGPEIAFETQKMYYTRNTFSVCSVERGISYFLGCDSGYNMVRSHNDGTPGIVPEDLRLQPLLYPRDHIRNLQIRVKLEQFHSDMPRDDMTDYEKYAYERRFLRFTQTNLEALEGFLKRRHKHGINIEFVVLTDTPSFESQETGLAAQCNYVNFLQCIRNIVYKMMHDYDDISVMITHHDENISAFPRNITGVFGLTKEQWGHEKHVQDNPHDWAEGFYLAVPGMDEDNMLGGYPAQELDAMLRQRWGIFTVLATRATHPISDGRYWPRPVRAVLH